MGTLFETITGKNSPVMQEHRFIPGSGRSTIGKWQLHSHLGEFHGQRAGELQSPRYQKLDLQ